VDKFIPFQKKIFLDIPVNIPYDPDYFLKANYGPKYMEIAKSNYYCHKEEKRIDDIVYFPINKIPL
jgi:hypothetical protein